ncbi:hypothetical protein HYX19_02535, partial [Candidatus Woesearchaeota archaeon]|nr:hypothetical protein [Candidatus Woesearchaeota archaeon]
MHKIQIRFKRIEAIKVDTNRNFFDLLFVYDENDEERQVQKRFLFDTDLPYMVKHLVSEIKLKAKNDYSTKLMKELNDDNLLVNFMHVVLDESEIGEAETKLVNGIKRLRDSVRNFKNVKSANNYMDYMQNYSQLGRMRID